MKALLDEGLRALAAQPPLPATGLLAVVAGVATLALTNEYTVTSFKGVPLYRSSGSHTRGDDAEAEDRYKAYFGALGIEPPVGSFSQWPRDTQEVYMDWLQLQRDPHAECVGLVVNGQPFASCLETYELAPYADEGDDNPDRVEVAEIELHNVVPPPGQVAAAKVMRQALDAYGYDAGAIMGGADASYSIASLKGRAGAPTEAEGVTAKIRVTGRELPRKQQP